MQVPGPPRRFDAGGGGPGEPGGCQRRVSSRSASSTGRELLDGGDVRERRLAKFRQNVARFRLYRLRFLQENMRFAAFFKIYQIF